MRTPSSTRAASVIAALSVLTCAHAGQTPGCPADIVADGTADGVDLAAVLAAWGTSGGAHGADVTGDGIVDGADLTVVLAGWGPCPAATDCTAANWVPGANLSGCDLSGASMESVNLGGANLRGANLAGARLSNVTLATADLMGAILDGTEFTSCNLAGAGMTGASARSSRFDSCQASGAVMVGMDLTGAAIVQGDFRGADLRNADLGGALIRGGSLDQNQGLMSLSGARLQGAAMAGMTFRYVSLTDVDINGWDLSTVRFEGVLTCNGFAVPPGTPASWGPYRKVVATGGGGQRLEVLLGPGVFFYNTHFLEKNLSGIDLSRSTCFSATFVQCDLAGANFEEADFNCRTCSITSSNSGSRISNCNVEGARFAGAHQYRLHAGGLTGIPATWPPDWELINGSVVAKGAQVGSANLAGRDLSGRDFRDTVFLGTDFTGANLAGTDFSSWNYASIVSNFTNANLAGANFSGTALGSPSPGGGWTQLGGANIDGARFTNASIQMVSSGQLTGEPIDLPPTHRITNGYLIGPKAFLGAAALSGADLRGANLGGAWLDHADLSYADLSGASLRGILRWYAANLSFANLTGANLGGSMFFQYANTTGAIWQSTTCPSGGPPQDCSCQAYPDGNCP